MNKRNRIHDPIQLRPIFIPVSATPTCSREDRRRPRTWTYSSPVIMASFEFWLSQSVRLSRPPTLPYRRKMQQPNRRRVGSTSDFWALAWLCTARKFHTLRRPCFRLGPQPIQGFRLRLKFPLPSKSEQLNILFIYIYTHENFSSII